MLRLSIIALALLIGAGQGYVLLQVRKGDNQSDVDAVIHKVVPNSNGEESRKRLANGPRYGNRPKVDKSGLESIVLAINTGASPNQVGSGSTLMKKVQELLVDFLKDERVDSYFRANRDSYKVKPEIVHFRSGKPSLMLEVNFESVMSSVKDALRSQKVRSYTDGIAQKAAIVYRTLVDEIKGTGKGGIKEYL
ncbi:unnamed protein product, partial [Iphiclides podalirius]